MARVVAGRGYGLDFSLAHKVRTTLGDVAWIVPGDGFICVMASTPIVAGCNTTGATIEQGMSVVAILPAPIGRGKRYDLYGIAPDAVRQVEVTPEGGSSVRVPVVDGVYAYSAPRMLHARVVR
jgi:hypothetical protein